MQNTSLITTILFALIGGILPALIWLHFWLKEDRAHPEPKKLILLTFFLGALCVPVALFAQWITSHLFTDGLEIDKFIAKAPQLGLIILITWSFIEESLKWLAAYFGGLHTRDNDEPVDPVIYMITSALGFAALENALFLFAPILTGDTATALITTNMRFIGATLLHIACSSLIGFFMAFSYFFKKELKAFYLIAGFGLSIGLHTLFNLSIIKNKENIFTTFLVVWLVIAVVLVLFEKIKKIHLNKINE